MYLPCLNQRPVFEVDKRILILLFHNLLSIDVRIRQPEKRNYTLSDVIEIFEERAENILSGSNCVSDSKCFPLVVRGRVGV